MKNSNYRLLTQAIYILTHVLCYIHEFTKYPDLRRNMKQAYLLALCGTILHVLVAVKLNI